ncbi:MAG: PEGA domain-containing protein [Deltaproteobacteria bacterium]|nr:PEGA domain-containing protein [Deltaproteobacteria bacterium]
MVRQVTIWLLVALSLCCKPKETTVRFLVDARTNQGEPVHAAQVIVDGKIIGQTTNDGAFRGELKLPVAATKKLEIKKDSDTHYFAPYTQTFDVSSVTPQEVTVAAVLYFVPKPSPESAKTLAGPPITAAGSVEEGMQDVTTDSDAERQSESHVDQPREPELTQQNLPSIATNIGDETPKEGIENQGVAKTSLGEEKSRLDGVVTEAPHLVTIHVVSGTNPLAGVEVAVGEEGASQLKSGCTTNQRGRCVIRFAKKPSGELNLVATKNGFKTGVLKITSNLRDKVRIQLEQGRTLDVYAVTESYGHVYGLEDVEVHVRGKLVGNTDRFGRLSYVFKGKGEELVPVGLKPESYIPEQFETDFVASDQMTLVKYFAPLEPPAARISLLNLVVSGGANRRDLSKRLTEINRLLDTSVRKHIFGSMAFKEVPLEQIEQRAKKIGTDIRTVAKRGWKNTDLNAMMDAVIQPNLMIGPKPVLELMVINSDGKTIAAAKEEIVSIDDLNAVDKNIAKMAERIDRVFPFEGAVLKRDGDRVVINLGRTQGFGIKPGDQFDLYGTQAEKLGRRQSFGRIGTLTVRSVQDDSAICGINQVLPRATVGRGDLVKLRGRKNSEDRTAEIRVFEGRGNTAHAVSQANVYLNDEWIGSTDAEGRLVLPQTGSGELKIVKIGFSEHHGVLSANGKNSSNIVMQRLSAILKVDSKPSKATVKIDGNVVGVTPLVTPITVHSGFIKLELEGVPGYRGYKTVLELDQGALELVGEESIVLDPDLRSIALDLLKSGKPEEAIDRLNQVKPDHTDYLMARHEIGEIYLNQLDQPAKAAAAFGQVTASEAVKQFNDKRFVPSHINEGIALFATGEKLALENPEAARAHYQKALEVLDRVMPFLRFVAAKDYPQAVHNVDYHRALSRHRLWTVTQDPKLLVETVRGWRNYLEGSARTIPVNDDAKAFIGNAEVFLKQASAQLGGARGTMRQ